MEAKAISQALIRQQGFALFEFLGDRAFRLVGEPAGFWHDLPGMAQAAETPIKLGERFPFLDPFLVEAERIWASRSESCAESGFWIEKSISGRELALEARALWLVGTPILAIQNPQERYEREVRLHQKARESILRHESLLREIENKEILLHCIVHLVQPLAVIRACLTLLSVEGTLSPSVKQAVEAAERQSRRQEEMIRGILEAYSAELGARKAVEEDPANAPDLARCEATVVETFEKAFAERNVRLELDSAVDPNRTWRVRGDEPHLLRVFGNLLENALHRSPPESTVKLGVEDQGEFLCAFVDDAGPDVPRGEAAERLFTTLAGGQEKPEGTAGLGLYFCKITIERWGGAIGCATHPTGGARFWFRLPRV